MNDAVRELIEKRLTAVNSDIRDLEGRHDFLMTECDEIGELITERLATRDELATELEDNN